MDEEKKFTIPHKKLIAYLKLGWPEELYNLVRNPREWRDLTLYKSEAVKRIRSHLAGLHKNLRQPPEPEEVVNVELEQGRALVSQDISETSNVCVIGQEVRQALFPAKDPMGESILIARYPNSVPFEVVGILRWLKTAGTPARGSSDPAR